MLVGGSSKSALDAFLSDFSPLRPAGRATFSCRRAVPAALAGSGTASSAAFADSVRSESPALARRASTCSCVGVARAPSAPPSPGAEATALCTSSRRCWISCSNRSSMIARTSPGSLCTLASAPSSALSDAVAAWIAGRPNTVGALTIISRMRRFPSSSTEAAVHRKVVPQRPPPQRLPTRRPPRRQHAPMTRSRTRTGFPRTMARRRNPTFLRFPVATHPWTASAALPRRSDNMLNIFILSEKGEEGAESQRSARSRYDRCGIPARSPLDFEHSYAYYIRTNIPANI